MAITWKKLKEEYDKIHGSKNERMKNFYEQCFLLFERVIREHLPAAIENPKILLKDSETLIKQLNNYEFPRKYLYSIRTILSIVGKAYFRNYNPSKAHADRKTFSISETGACLGTWLKNQEWEVSNSYYGNFFSRRKKEIMVFELLESERKNKNKSSFFQNAGHHMVKLLEKKHYNPAFIPAIAFPDDQPTIKAIRPLIKYFKKLGIKLYAVKSAELVRQL